MEFVKPTTDPNGKPLLQDFTGWDVSIPKMPAIIQFTQSAGMLTEQNEAFYENNNN